MIVVLDAFDIVLAEIAPGLHLDQFKIDLAGILQAVPGAARHIDRFVFVQHLHLVADRHPRRAANDDPMLGPVMVQLQRQPAALLRNPPVSAAAAASR